MPFRYAISRTALVKQNSKESLAPHPLQINSRSDNFDGILGRLCYTYLAIKCQEYFLLTASSVIKIIHLDKE